MSDLIEFLRARYDERERGIRQAIATYEMGVSEFDLADVEAKRRILELHQPYDPAVFNDCSSCGDVPQVPYPCDTLLALALPYADHPDYDEGWKP